MDQKKALTVDDNINPYEWPYLIRLVIIMVLVSSIVHIAFGIIDYKLNGYALSKELAHEYHYSLPIGSHSVTYKTY